MISFGRCLQWNKLAKAAAFVALILPIPMASAIGDEIDGAAETIVFVRHGEKPEGGFGQLNCQGRGLIRMIGPWRHGGNARARATEAASRGCGPL